MPCYNEENCLDVMGTLTMWQKLCLDGVGTLVVWQELCLDVVWTFNSVTRTWFGRSMNFQQRDKNFTWAQLKF